MTNKLLTSIIKDNLNQSELPEFYIGNKFQEFVEEIDLEERLIERYWKFYATDKLENYRLGENVWVDFEPLDGGWDKTPIKEKQDKYKKNFLKHIKNEVPYFIEVSNDEFVSVFFLLDYLSLKDSTIKLNLNENEEEVCVDIFVFRPKDFKDFFERNRILELTQENLKLFNLDLNVDNLVSYEELGDFVDTTIEDVSTLSLSYKYELSEEPSNRKDLSLSIIGCADDKNSRFYIDGELIYWIFCFEDNNKLYIQPDNFNYSSIGGIFVFRKSDTKGVNYE